MFKVLLVFFTFFCGVHTKAFSNDAYTFIETVSFQTNYVEQLGKLDYKKRLLEVRHNRAYRTEYLTLSNNTYQWGLNNYPWPTCSQRIYVNDNLTQFYSVDQSGFVSNGFKLPPSDISGSLLYVDGAELYQLFAYRDATKKESVVRFDLKTGKRKEIKIEDVYTPVFDPTNPVDSYDHGFFFKFDPMTKTLVTFGPYSNPTTLNIVNIENKKVTKKEFSEYRNPIGLFLNTEKQEIVTTATAMGGIKVEAYDNLGNLRQGAFEKANHTLAVDGMYGKSSLYIKSANQLVISGGNINSRTSQIFVVDLKSEEVIWKKEFNHDIKLLLTYDPQAKVLAAVGGSGMNIDVYMMQGQ